MQSEKLFASAMSAHSRKVERSGNWASQNSVSFEKSHSAEVDQTHLVSAKRLPAAHSTGFMPTNMEAVYEYSTP